MRLSVETAAVRDCVGDMRALEMIREAGFDCVDFSYYWTTPYSPVIGEEYAEYAHAVRAKLDELGLVCNQAHAPFTFKYGGTFDMENPDYRSIVRAIESASILGASQIIVHSIGVGEADRKTVTFEDYNYAFYKSFEPYCEKFGIRVAVENLFSRDKKRGGFRPRPATPEQLNSFVRLLDSPWFVICVDIGHAALGGYEPEDFIEGTDGALLQAIHVQDGDYLDDRHTLPFLGQFHWAEIMQSLRTVGYRGDLTFEIFKYLKDIPAELLPDALTFAQRTGRHLIGMFEHSEP